MKRNKKLLILFLSLNSILTSYAAAVTEKTYINTKYDRIYNNVTKNLQNGKSNQIIYQSLENILKKKNKELKDLYSQGNYVIKPEYLEWQIFFTEFYGKNEKGDNTLENAANYTSARTRSGKLTVNSVLYNKLLATELTEEQLDKLFSGDKSMIDSLTDEQKKFFIHKVPVTGLSNHFNVKKIQIE